MKKPATDIVARVRQLPSTRRMLSERALLCGLRQPCGDDFLRGLLLSELLVRLWLTCGGVRSAAPRTALGSVDGVLRRTFTDPQTAALEKWFRSQATARSFRIPLRVETVGSVSGAHALRGLARDLEDWRSAHGVLVVVQTQRDPEVAEAVGLPYVIDPFAGKRGSVLRDANDRALSIELDHGVRLANQAARRLGYMAGDEHASVMLTTLHGEVDVPLMGESAGLSILISHALRSESVQAGPFSWAASGSVTPDGQIRIDAHDRGSIQQKARYFRSLGIRRIILPQTGERVHGVQNWTGGQPLKSLVARLAQELRGNIQPASPLKTAEEDLARIDRGMRHATLTAAVGKERLLRHLRQFEPRKDLRSRHLVLKAGALLASAECHLGNFRESQSISRKLRRAATGVAPSALPGIMIRQAVNLTDDTRYRDAVALCDEAVLLIRDNSSELERMDWEMQAAGTKAQALTYWALLDRSKTAPAMRELQQATRLARILDVPGESDRDLPRQLNYRCLGAALLDRSGFGEAYKAALPEQGPAGASRDYLLRIRWLAAYRALLAEESFPWRGFEHELPPVISAAGAWLRATSLKYRGTLRAAAGEFGPACADFKEGCELLKAQRGNLLAFIGATIALQAGVSLAGGDGAASRDFFGAAERSFGEFHAWFQGILSGGRWLKWTQRASRRNIADAFREDNPQRYYPY